MKFVEQFMSFNGGYNPKEPSIKYHSFQFFKYHSLKVIQQIIFQKSFKVVILIVIVKWSESQNI